MPTLDIAGWRVAYQESGVGLPIVFIHGITENRQSFALQLSGLSNRFRAISYDLRATSGNEELEVLVEDLAHLLDALRISGAVIVGHSFGGLVAQQFAKAHPDRAAALVLISTFAKAPDHSYSKLLSRMSSGHLFEPKTTMGRIKRFLGLEKAPEYDEDNFLHWVAKQSAITSPQTIHSRIRMIRHFDSRRWLDQLFMPTLLLVGQHDQPAFLSAAQMIQRSTPDSMVDVIPDSAHFPHIERYDLVNSYIDDFVFSRLTSLVD